MAEPDGPPHDLGRLVEVLDRHRVDYLLLVGGVAALAYGAKRPTEDADCVVGRERSNLDRLAAALRELDARLRVAGLSDEEARRLPVQIDAAALESAGMTTWMTDAGGDESQPLVVAKPPSQYFSDLRRRYLPECHRAHPPLRIEVPSRVDYRPALVDSVVVP